MALIEECKSCAVVAKFTGLVSIVNNGMKSYHAFRSGNISAGSYYAARTIGQGVAIAFGEEFELAWNTATLVDDIFFKH